ncbi:FG-GAP-like repeat-containing protein [Zhongshania marina]|uniref:Insecticide toxin TcdB middle/N-terminal domain-containing protein n=1 Tax=Zhongshania marina TaxID=2304603 RepID=A0A2S4HBZ3_9GAMM|nr:FG-GAP-like repeat-containing protein [Marortus luteolus]POP51522.1 hypothetical protein C0068_16420 [Marortus luteolus]
MARLFSRCIALNILTLLIGFTMESHAATMVASAVSGQYDVGNDGSAQYNIPVNLPAGVQGMKPDIAITYSSNGGNGVVGMGFDIAGLSSIHRCSTTIFRDGYHDGINFDDDDQFCIDGQRLIAVNGEYGAAGTEYRTEYDNISKIVSYGSEGTLMEGETNIQATNGAHNPIWFKVWTADGRVHIYGDESNVSSNARASVERTFYTCPIAGSVILGGPSDSYFVCYSPTGQLENPVVNVESRSYEWRVAESVDRFDNKIQYYYHDDDENGEYLIGHINYNFVGTEPQNEVKFLYETRPDTSYGFFAGQRNRHTMRLKSVTGLTTATTLGVKQREMKLTYTTNAATGESRVASVQECVSYWCAPATYFTWDDGQPGFSAQAVNSGSSEDGGNQNPHVMDVNGDGRDDLVQSYGGYWRILLSNGGGLITQTTAIASSNPATSHSFRYNDDLKEDLLVDYGGVWHVLQATTTTPQTYTFQWGGQPVTVTIPGGPNFTKISTGINVSNASTTRLMDVDGDGRKDLVYYDNSQGFTWVRFLGKGANGGFGDPQITNLYYNFVNGKVWIADFNGDGLDDVLQQITSSSWGVYYSQGGPVFKYRSGFGGPDGFSGMKVADVNGDSLPDLITRYDSKIWFRINTGHGFTEPTIAYPSNIFGNSQWDNALVYDYNADGQADILFSYGNQWGVLTSNGTTMSYTATGIPSTGWDWGPQVADITGNGMSDLILAISNTWQVRLHNNERPDYLAKVSNGMGVETEFEYRFLNDPTDPYFYDRGSDAVYPLVNVQNASYLVSKVSQSNGIGGKNSNSYRYKKLLIHQEGLGNLGFEQVKIINNDTGIETVSTFSQDYENLLQGTLKEVTTTSPLTGSTLSKTENQWSVNYLCAGGDGSDCTDGPTDIDTVRYFRSVLKTTVTKKDLNGAFLHKEVVTNPSVADIYYEVDNSSRVMVSKVYSSASATTPIRTTTTTSKYKNDTTNWLMGMLTSSSVTTVVPNKPALTRTSEFDYDTVGSNPTGRKMAERIMKPGTSTALHTTRYGINEAGQTSVDSFGHNLAVTVSGPDFASRTSKVTYDNTGRYVMTETNALGQSVSHEYLDDSSAGAGLRTRTTDANGLVSAFAYDYFRRLRQSAVLYGTANQVIANTFYLNCSSSTEFCPSDPTWTAEYYIQSLGADGSESHEYFDKLGRTLRKAVLGFASGSEEWILMDYEYDAKGHNVKVSEPYKAGTGSPSWNTIVYDQLGRPVTTVNADGRYDTVNYNGLTVISTMNIYGWPQKKTETRDSLGNLIQVKDTANRLLQYEYDAFGQMTAITPVTLSPATTISYDVLGRKSSMDDPDKGVWSYTYNGLGQLITQTNALGKTTCSAYDKLGRKVKRIDAYTGTKPSIGNVGQTAQSTNQCAGNTANVETTTWQFDTASGAGIGKLHWVKSPNGYQQTATYDSFGRGTQLAEKISGVTYYSNTTYDSLNRVATVQYPGPSNRLTIENVYNNRGYLSALKNAANNEVYYTVNAQDARGNIVNALLGNGLTTQHQYDAATGYLEQVVTQNALLDYRQNQEFSFDKLGNLYQRIDHVNGFEEDFVYDVLNRLFTTKADFGNGEEQVVDIRYDPLGNIISKTGVGVYTYGSTCSNGGAGPHAVCQITGGGIGSKNTNYSYDLNGNMLSGDGRSITWNLFDKPTFISQGTTNKTTMGYGADRQLITRMDETAAGISNTVFVGGLYEKVTLPNGDIKERHYVGGNTIVTYKNRTANSAGTVDTRYLHKDHIGSTVLITDENGEEVESFSFDPWGKRRATTLAEIQSILGSWSTLSAYQKGNLTISALTLSSDITNKGFTGHEQLDGVNLIHMGGRVYDAEIGRFLSADPFVGDSTNLQALNRYSYVENNPLSYTDPSGFFLKKLVKKIGNAIGKAHKAVADAFLSAHKKFFREIGRVEGLSTAISIGLGIVCNGAAAACVAAFNAAMTAANGGTIEQVITGAAVGYIAGEFTTQLGVAFDAGNVGNVGAAMFVGGSVAKAQGGKFIDGVKGAAVGAAIGYGIHRILNPEPANSGFSTDEDGERYFLDSDGNRAYPDRFLNEDGNPLLAMNLEERILLDKVFYGDEQAGIMACSPYIDCMKAVEAGYGPDIIDNPNWETIVDKSNSILRKSWKFFKNPSVGFGISVGEKVNANQVCTEYAKNSGVTCY